MRNAIHLFIQQIGQLYPLAGFQPECTAIPFPYLNAIGKQRIVGDIKTVHRTTPGKSGIFNGIALVEGNRFLAIGPGKIGIMGLADIGYDILFGSQKVLSRAISFLYNGTSTAIWSIGLFLR